MTSTKIGPDNQLSADGEVSGLFTGEPRRVDPRGAAVGGIRGAAAVHDLRGRGATRLPCLQAW